MIRDEQLRHGPERRSGPRRPDQPITTMPASSKSADFVYKEKGQSAPCSSDPRLLALLEQAPLCSNRFSGNQNDRIEA
jgi:hypothetical protein